MSDAPSTTGPDLAAGIAAGDLGEGQMLTGHVGDENVLLARRGGEIFAIGANASHYGGPLARGSLGRRHGALSLASRLFQPAHRRSAARTGA